MKTKWLEDEAAGLDMLMTDEANPRTLMLVRRRDWAVFDPGLAPKGTAWTKEPVCRRPNQESAHRTAEWLIDERSPTGVVR